MTAASLVRQIRAHGVELIPDGERIRFRPRTALPPDLFEELRARKAEVLKLLAPPQDGQDGHAPSVATLTTLAGCSRCQSLTSRGLCVVLCSCGFRTSSRPIDSIRSELSTLPSAYRQRFATRFRRLRAFGISEERCTREAWRWALWPPLARRAGGSGPRLVDLSGVRP